MLKETSSPTGAPPTLERLSTRVGLPAPDEGDVEAADGARLRYAHWRAPEERRQGSILYLNGRTEFIEKTMEVYAILWKSGFDLWTFDWRGQGLSTRKLADREKGHVTDYQLYLDDLHRFVSEVTDLQRSGGKTLMLGHSMGGHLGLRYLHDRPGLFDAAVFSAPMIDIAVNREPLRRLNALIVRLGYGESYALGTGRFRFVYQNPKQPSDHGEIADYRARIERFALLTHDARKFRDIERSIRDNRDLAVGGPTAAWLRATFQSIALTWSKGYAEAIETPVLMIGGGRDKVVLTARQEAMARRLPNGRFHALPKAAHELLVECDDVRAEFFERFAAFAGVSITLPAIDMSGCVRR